MRAEPATGDGRRQTGVDVGGYIYDATWERELERLRGLEAAADPPTLAAFQAVGVSRGWRCLEVGAGGGSITAALAGLVGPTGRVVAVDGTPPAGKPRCGAPWRPSWPATASTSSTAGWCRCA